MQAISKSVAQTIFNTYNQQDFANIGKACVSEWLGLTMTPATLAAIRSTARQATTRAAGPSTSRQATATRANKIGPTVQTLIDFYAVNPGGHSEAELAQGTKIRPNILGRVLKAKSSPFRKSGDLWLMRGGATVSRKLTQPLQQAA